VVDVGDDREVAEAVLRDAAGHCQTWKAERSVIPMAIMTTPTT